MKIRTVTFDQLTPGELDAWSAIQLANPLLSSPYFRPEFTGAMAQVRQDVEVAVLEEAGQAVGFFPFQRTSWNAGRPIAGRLSDYHAVIAPSELELDPVALVRGCKLSSWYFDHLVANHASFDRYAWSTAESPYIDLTGGFEALLERKGGMKGIMSEFGQKSRKFAREVAPLRFEANLKDPALLHLLIQWKTAQYQRTGVDNIFAFPWVHELLERILAFDSPHIESVLSVTYVGDTIAAMNFGMRAGAVLHPWFPTYNVDLQKYSPGTLHWILTLQAAEAMGVSRVDLVSGGETYKQRFASGAIRVAQGTVDPRPSLAAARRAWRRTREYVRSTPVYARVRGPVRVLHNMKAWLELR